ncbi:hypothetical protein QTP70_031368 [Hemibagrus guttatus]|uniref:Uncharacterized protein n=1 Tax=Hemibagrus guttatus TaxID=175788 RepID=A0AAE0PUT9_9TELE|nr:hypothetical protein QTP70_031368 [Hemibagrus guttatus]
MMMESLAGLSLYSCWPPSPSCCSSS